MLQTAQLQCLGNRAEHDLIIDYPCYVLLESSPAEPSRPTDVSIGLAPSGRSR